MDPALLIAAAEHGPGRHGAIGFALLAIAVVAGLAYLVRRGRQ